MTGIDPIGPGAALELRRDDLLATRWTTRPDRGLEAGEVRLAIDTFGLSTNNVTFGIAGDLLGYWKLFPAADEAWGRVPVFGFAEVVESRHDDVVVGRRVFGYLPIAEQLPVSPVRVDGRGFLDGAPHRRDVMATVWNHYQFVDPDGDPTEEGLRSLLRPLFVTAFLIDDFIADHEGFGADTLVITSASARTAIATAHQAHRRRAQRVVGLTSPSHQAFAAGLGVYDEVLPYAEAGSVAGDRAVVVDIAGRIDARDGLHERFGDQLAHSMTVGLSNVPDPARILAPPPPTGPAPEMFYAQLQVAKRADDWGQEVLDQRLDDDWAAFLRFAQGWLAMRRVAGQTDVESTWRALVAGDLDPAEGLQLTLRKGA